MGLSLRDGASVFQLECDRSRARYGVIWLAFRFDPPVAADVLGEFDGIGSAMLVSARVPHPHTWTDFQKVDCSATRKSSVLKNIRWRWKDLAR